MDWCTGSGVNPLMAKSLRTTIVTEGEFSLFSGYSKRPDSMQDSLTDPLYSRGCNGRRTDNKVKLLCIVAGRVGTRKWKSGHF
jgi:hypothetical protein